MWIWIGRFFSLGKMGFKLLGMGKKCQKAKWEWDFEKNGLENGIGTSLLDPLSSHFLGSWSFLSLYIGFSYLFMFIQIIFIHSNQFVLVYLMCILSFGETEEPNPSALVPTAVAYGSVGKCSVSVSQK